IFLTTKEEANDKLTIKLYRKDIINTPRKLFKYLNNIEINSFIKRGIFYIIKYNKK
ncbi:hypothetical protein LX36DRAFT_550789, partial [Colletotrichum falcatum]